MKIHNKLLISMMLCLPLLQGCLKHSQQTEAPKATTSTIPVKIDHSTDPRIDIKTDAPSSYIVKKGDTLWRIASRYLSSPWQWKHIWKVNPKIRNPHKIYPGDELAFENGKVFIKSRGQGYASSGGIPTVRLKPGMKEMPADLGIPTIELSEVETILNKSIVLEPKEIPNFPYVLGIEFDRIQTVLDSRIYIKGHVKAGHNYNVYRIGNSFGLLGTEMVKVGEVTIERANIPMETVGNMGLNWDRNKKSEPEFMSSALVKRLEGYSVQANDILIEQKENEVVSNIYFRPEPAPKGMKTTIISSPLALSALGVGQTIILDKGSIDGVEVGHTFVATTRGGLTTDVRTGRQIKLPGEVAGAVIIYKTFDKTSFGLIVRSPEPIYIGTTLIAP